MEYFREFSLKNGKKCTLRHGTEEDGEAVLDHFRLTHAETDYLLTYPDETTFDALAESRFLKEKAESDNEVELVAVVEGCIAGSAGIHAIGTKYKVRHRAELGLSVTKAFWGLGIGRALTVSCIECAKAAGYRQLELDVVADNERAISLYRSLGFAEYGRNPKGFLSRTAGYQEIVSMRLGLP